MAFSIPTLTETSRWLRGLVSGAIKGARADLWPNNLTIFVKALAMAAGQGNLRAEWIFKQIFVSTADADMLDLHGYEIGLARKSGSVATGQMVFAATEGAILPAGAVIDAGGLSFSVRAAAVAAGNSISVVVDGLETGMLGNLPAGAEVRLREPWDGVTQAGEVGPLGLSGGFAKELDEPYRRRLVFRKRNKPRGGTASDYQGWVGEVSGFTTSGSRAFAATPTAGTVTVYPLLEGSGAERQPSPADVVRCADHIETKRPLAATVLVIRPQAKGIGVTIANLENDSISTRAEIVAELLDMFDERAFVARGGETFPASWISEAVSRALGESRHRLVEPSGDTALAAGEFPVFAGLTVV